MDDPLVENPKNFPENFFILGVGGKKDPPPLEILGFLRHFGQQTVAAQKAWIQGGVGVRGYGGRGI